MAQDEDSPTQAPHSNETADLGPQAPPPPKHERTTHLEKNRETASLQDRIRKRLSSHDEESSQLHDPLIGQTIHKRFKIEERIGAGGMGTVYKASQLGMKRAVAIKVLRRELTENETVVRRFHLEALAVSKLNHPNTVQIYDFGETEDGLLYIAMELLEGESLSDLIRRERQVSVTRALHMVEQVCKSLHEAHAKGIIHRDLKPDNIFVRSLGNDQDFVKVLDFGVAKVAEGDGQEKTLTKAGAIFGTPKYMSPEQSRGAEIDARSDIYAIGIILYELIMGRVPFNADSPLGILIKHLQELPPGFQELRPDLVVPEQVERLVRRLLSKDPDQRPQTCEAVIREAETLREAMPPLFRKVVTRAEAEAAGLEVETLSVTEINTQTSSGFEAGPTLSGHQTLPSIEHKRKIWPTALIMSLTATLGAGGILYSQLGPLDTTYYHAVSLPESRSELLPMPTVPEVNVHLISTPDGARVLNEDGEELGVTRLQLDRPKGSPSLVVTLEKEGYKSHSRTIDFDKNDAVFIRLEADTPDARPVIDGATLPRPEPKPPKAVEPAPQPATPPKPRDPFDGPRKMDDIKSNPFD